jgi:hypothetical protein
MVVGADEEADLVLAQTAILLDRQGDREAAQLLADVTYLDFENTDDSYRTSNGTHVYAMAASQARLTTMSRPWLVLRLSVALGVAQH